MKGFLRGLLWACLALTLIVGVIAAVLWGAKRHGMRPIEARQRVLLHGTDHGQLREAMRELWQASRHQPGGVNVEMGGQWCQFGFDAYFAGHPTDPDRPVWKDAYPSREVAPELWFYAENGLVEP